MRMLLFSLSSHLVFRRRLGLVPVTFILCMLLVMWVSSLRITWPYHDNRFCVKTDLIGVTFAIPPMVSILILSFLVFPWLHLSIFIYVVCKRCSSCLRSSQHSLPYPITGLTTVLYSLLFSFTSRLYLLIIPSSWPSEFYSSIDILSTPSTLIYYWTIALYNYLYFVSRSFLADRKHSSQIGNQSGWFCHVKNARYYLHFILLGPTCRPYTKTIEQVAS